jgi:hypothetical protein
MSAGRFGWTIIIYQFFWFCTWEILQFHSWYQIKSLHVSVTISIILLASSYENSRHNPSYVELFYMEVNYLSSHFRGGRFGVRFPGRGNVFSPKRPDRLWGSRSLLLTGYRRLFAGGWNGRGAEVKNEWSYTSTCPVCLHGMGRHNISVNEPPIRNF